MEKKKKIEDYLHLYIGCEAQFWLQGASWISEMKIHDVARLGGRLDWMKLILRPLSDMTEMEIIKLLVIVYKSIYSYGPDITTLSLHTEGKDSVGLKCIDRLDDSELGFTIQVDRGVEFSTNGTHSMVNQFECTQWLLKNGFDLFGLIEADLAIDKTKKTSKSTKQKRIIFQ